MAGFLNIVARLGMDASGYTLGWKRAQSQTKVFAREIKSALAQAFGTAALIAFSKKIVDSADSVVDLSEQLGVSTKELQQWQFAARKSGADASVIEKVFETIAKTRQEAIEGNQELQESYMGLGVGIMQLGKLQTPDILKKAGEAFRNGGDPQVLGPLLRAIGGKSATKLIPAFSEGLDELFEKANKAGQVFDEGMLQTLKAAKTEAERLADTFKGPVANGIIYISKLLTAMTDALQTYVGGAAAYWGAFTMDIDPTRDMTSWDYKEANKRGLDAMNGFAEEAAAQREARDEAARKKEEAMREPIGPPVPPNWDPLYGKRPADRILGMGMKVIGDHSKPDGLTEWQRMGAAVRQEATAPVLKEISKNTEKTAEKLDAIAKLYPKSGDGFGGMGGGF